MNPPLESYVFFPPNARSIQIIAINKSGVISQNPE